MTLKRMDNVGMVVEDLGGTIDRRVSALLHRGPEGLLIGLAQELS